MKYLTTKMTRKARNSIFSTVFFALLSACGPQNLAAQPTPESSTGTGQTNVSPSPLASQAPSALPTSSPVASESAEPNAPDATALPEESVRPTPEATPTVAPTPLPGNANTRNSAQISFGTPVNRPFRLEIVAPGGNTDGVDVRPDGSTHALTVNAYDAEGRLLDLGDDFVWTFPNAEPYAGYVTYPHNNASNQALLKGQLSTGSNTLQVESLSTGLTDTLEVRAEDVPMQVTAFSISPAPVSDCAVSLPREEDILCAVTLEAGTNYIFTTEFRDENRDIMVPEINSNQQAAAFEGNFTFLPGASINVAPPADNEAVYLSGFFDNLSLASSQYGFEATDTGSGNFVRKQYQVQFRFANATNGPGGRLRMRAETASGQQRNLSWEITVQ